MAANPPPVLGVSPPKRQVRKKEKENSYLVQPLVQGGHEDECQDKVKSMRMQGDREEEGEEDFSSCDLCLSSASELDPKMQKAVVKTAVLQQF